MWQEKDTGLNVGPNNVPSDIEVNPDEFALQRKEDFFIINFWVLIKTMLSISKIIQMHSWIKDFPSSDETFLLPRAQPSFQWSRLHTNTLQRLRNS